MGAVVTFLLRFWPHLFIAAAIVAALAWAHRIGANGVQSEWDASVARGEAEIARLRNEAGKVTTRVETKYVDRIVTVEGKTREIIREVPVYVPAGAVELPPGWRLLHDAAAEGSVPDPADLADAAPVDAQAAATTVVENYGACHVIATRLTSLQEWVREQAALNPGD